MALGLVLLAIVTTLSVTALMSRYYFYDHAGKVRCLGVVMYESDGVTLLTHIDWGWNDEPSTKNYLSFANNTGNFNITLSKNENNFQPSEAVTYISLVWNYTGAVIEPLETIPIQLTLIIQDIPDVNGTLTPDLSTFAFDTTITGTSTS